MMEHGTLKPKIRVFIVDDAVVVRKALSDTLSADPEIEVVGSASNGRLALAKIPNAHPEVVTLDVEMPEMDGLETLRRLRQDHPHLQVIMFSNVTQHGAAATLDALDLGARDYVTKPANVGGPAGAALHIREHLIPRIKLFGSPRSRISIPWITAPPSPARRVDVVAIGVSTGGPNALTELIPSLPSTFPVPIAIVQHMPPIFTRYLAERLDARSSLTVREGADGEPLRPGSVYLAPGGHHLALRRQLGVVELSTNQDPPVNSCRPAADVLFGSVAELHGSHALAVILTGMGQDGLAGCRSIRERGGKVIVQDECTSVVWGMPAAVAGAGLADVVLPIEEIADEIVRRVQFGRLGVGS